MPTALLVTPYLTPHLGGVERYVDSVARHLARSDWRVIVATTTNEPGYLPEWDSLGIELRALRTVARYSNTPVGLRWGAELRSILATEHVDVVNAHAPVPGLADVAARAAGTTPLVLTYHSGHMSKKQVLMDAGLGLYEQIVLRGSIRRASTVICSSDYVREFLRPMADPARLEVVCPGIDVDTFRFAPWSTDRRNLLFVGSLERATRYKRLDTVIDALALLCAAGDEMALDVVGDGDMLPWYRERARTVGVADRVTFHGAVVPEKLPSLYHAARALVLPTEFDSLPTVILEAMACGTPVIASRVGGIPTLVHDPSTGLLVAPGDAGGVAEAVQALRDDRRIERVARSARRVVECRYTSEVLGERTASILARAASGAHSPPASCPSTSAPASPKRKLVMVTPYFPPHIGGVEQYSHHLALALAGTGRWNVTVLTTRGRGMAPTMTERDGLRIVQLGWWARYSYTPFSPLWIWQIRQILKRENPDVINAHTPVPILSDVAAAVARDPLFLLTYHAVSLEKDAGKLFDTVRHLYAFVENTTLKRADAVLAVCDVVAGELEDRTPTPVFRFGNAVRRADLSEEPPQPTDGHFVFLARLDKEHEWKGLEAVLNAVCLCPQATLTVAGDGDLRVFYARRAAELGVSHRVTFRGTVGGDEKRALIRSAIAIIAYPTTRNDGGFPTVVLEAWANAVPVLVSDIGSLHDAVRAGVDGWVIPPGDPPRLAQAMQGLMRDPALARAMGARGRERVEHMTWEEQALRFEDIVGLTRARAPIEARG